MKNNNGLLLAFGFLLLLVFIYQHFDHWDEMPVKSEKSIDIKESDIKEHVEVSSSSLSEPIVSSHIISSLSSTSLSSASLSSQNSSVQRLSYPKVDPEPHIKYFLESMDKTALPKIALTALKKDKDFDYKNATAQELRERALEGDALAAYKYADYVRTHIQHFKKMEDGKLYMIDAQENSTQYTEMRDFYMHALLGGAKQAAITLSHEYLNLYSFDPVEALAWRKISFAIGESEQWDCLRDSTTCIVKDFNNLNRMENFSPCMERQYQCKPEDFENATVRAMQYIQHYKFSPENELRK